MTHRPPISIPPSYIQNALRKPGPNSDRRASDRADLDSHADLNYLVDHYFNVVHICRQRSASAPPLRTDYTAQASHCSSVEQADLGVAMEISQAVGSHIGGLCDGRISTHEEVRTIVNEPSGDMFDASLYSWSTLLLPTLIHWPVPMTGTELDLGSAAFVNQLNTDLNTPLANFNSMVLLRCTIKEVRMFNQIICSISTEFYTISRLVGTLALKDNRLTWNSEGGVLPAIQEYSGSSIPPGSAVGLAFSGGQVPVNTNFDWGHFGRDAGTHQGVAKNYTVTQQGVTANVTCQPIDHSQDSFTAISNVTQGPVFALITWETIANCSGSAISVVKSFYFTAANITTGQMSNASEGFLPVVVCPNPNTTTFDPHEFYIFMAGEYKYNFLPTTVCEVVPYLTTVNVTYNEGIYIATMSYQSGSNQAMTSNPIGDFLTAYGDNNVSLMYNQLEDFWRGIMEFASTQLRSGYSTSVVPLNMTRPINGTMHFTTYGWQSNSLTYILVLVVITLIWGITVFAAGYSLIQEKHNPSDSSFDFSDLVDLIIAASDGRLESELREGDRNKVEDITVRFEDVPDEMGRIIRKRLVTVVSETLPKTV
ncbi:hypothetical protein BDR04DRAFT_1121778 [Suillus decipiens]|nr:hypothetical protein BDR04DRAFT_1121778 [Suillus decipiens]